MYYKAKLDDKHEYHYINYQSQYRANSKDNKADCMRAIRLKWGRSAAHNLKFICCYKINESEFYC